MSYPYPSLLPLLKFHCTPDQYWHIIVPKIGSGGCLYQNKLIAYDAYWQVVPTYTYAYCPICHTQYHEPADTYSILGWRPYRDLMPKLYVSSGHSTGSYCPHFLGVHAFINLHGQLPRELEYFDNNTGEVPYITPWFFPEDIESYAVLHALPICRIEADQFVPSYTVFSLTYFSQNPKLVLKRHSAAEAERGKGDSEYYPATVYPPIYAGNINLRPEIPRDPLYDLAQWAKRGQLGWLDFAEADLPLCVGKGMQLPEMYRKIHGNRSTYVWRKGHMHPF